MTVQDMDICLNISTKPVAKEKMGIENDSILNLMREKKIEKAKNKVKASTLNNVSVKETSTIKKRIKQKSLGTIVAKKLKESNQNQSSVIQNELKVKPQINNIHEDPQQRISKVEAYKNNIETSNKINDISNNPIISFTKTTKENYGKTILARKRKIIDTNSKRTLSSIFSRQSESEDVSLLNSLKKIQQEQSEKKDQKESNEESKKISSSSEKMNFDKKKKKKQIEKFKTDNDNNIEDDKNIHFSHKSLGKISSLFGHNPEIPNIGQRLVKPINEPIFTGTTFTDLNIHPFMISNLEQNMHITKMTTVQQKAIPQIFSRKDVLVRSQTGSGKTLAYALPIVECLHKIRPKLNRNSGLKALIVVPTRELALQTYECFLKLIKPFTWIVPGYLAGGEKRKAEKARLRKGCNILVGTPGRLLDHIQRTAALKLSDVKYFVLDEADRMFDMGYEKDISGIVSALKVSTPSQNTGYDAMKILRQNIKKFTDEDVEHLENNDDLEKSENDDQKESIVKSNKNINSECEDEIEDVKKKQIYHSSSDDDSDEGEPYVKSKKSDKQKIGAALTEQKEPDISKDKIQKMENDNNSEDESRRQTILLSATLTQAVEKLAGLAMNHPVFIDAAKENLETTDSDGTELNEDLVVPQSVNQSYIVTPPKLRLVTLSAYITGKCQSHGQHKILIFMATQDMVDYHTEILSSVLTKPTDEDDDDSDPLVVMEFFKLHGSMTQKERIEIFKTFRQAKSGILLCTDVAARGLDLPKVDCVIQYTGPTRIRIRQESMDDVLDRLMGPLSKHSSAHNAAVALQNDFENLILEDTKLRERACKAYTSWIRFYSSYPRDMRQIFNRRDLHLGHYAKSFALRETPQRIGGIGRRLHEKERAKKEQLNNNRLTSGKPDGEPAKKRQNRQGDEEAKMGLLKRVRMLNTSEYDSGLEPVKKPKKS
ncbi:ATP-dependent RNA helicase [Apis cerana cerana]|uniref:ATP-dependent RNA helicase n=1 Tax=Apis cerana cerana TaxID=94128 RepID=A0A2A3EB27_APICC|nr:ATP-dependent RNA helicase [Apis cerana cerana]